LGFDLDKLARFFRNSPDMKTRIPQLLVTFTLVCFALTQNTQAVNPPPDGGYPGGNTAEGQAALLGLTTGTYNTGVGLYSLLSLTDGSFNTAIGAGALLFNTADQNTATGAGALLHNTTGTSNTAMGEAALFSNTTGGFNTGVGDGVLNHNTTGSANTAIASNALNSNTTGSGNTVVGFNSGFAVTTVNNVICIGAQVAGANVNDRCCIGSIFGQTSSGGTAVFINAVGQLGTLTSSARFKDDIKPMSKASESVFSLKPVTFHYKKEIDPAGTSQFGLVAEEVEKVNPDLVVSDKEGKPYTVRYEAVNAMLLNEFLKEHRKVEQLEKQIEALTTAVHKVSAQLEANKPTPQVVANDQ